MATKPPTRKNGEWSVSVSMSNELVIQHLVDDQDVIELAVIINISCIRSHEPTTETWSTKMNKSCVWVCLKIVYPQIINFNRIFHHKPTILLGPPFMDPPMVWNCQGMPGVYPVFRHTHMPLIHFFANPIGKPRWILDTCHNFVSDQSFDP